MQLNKLQRRHLKPYFLMALVFGLTQCAPQSDQIPTSENANDIPQLPTLTIQPWPHDGATVAHVHVMTIPGNYPVEIAVSDVLKTVEEFATATGALAVLNGGFFDPKNAQTTSFIAINGTLVADPRHNPRLIDNPDLTVYIDQILNRSEFRRYNCAGRIRYDITAHNTSIPQGCELHSSLGAGPQLLPDDTSLAEGFIDYANNLLVRDAIGSQQRNARSAIGIQQDGTLVWLMVEQVAPNGGMTLAELTDFMANAKDARTVINRS